MINPAFLQLFGTWNTLISEISGLSGWVTPKYIIFF